MSPNVTSNGLRALLVGAALAAGSLSAALADDKPAPGKPESPAPSSAAAPTPTEPKTFASAEEAAKALFDALDRSDDAALRALLGERDADLVQDGGDPIARVQRRELAAAAKTRLLYETSGTDRVTLVVGEMGHPLAIPLRRDGERWRFDGTAGREELLARRIGEHELEAVGICLAYADAQVAYARKDRDGDGVKEYAQRLASTPGQKDGLHWDARDGDDSSPAGPDLVPLADADGADAKVAAGDVMPAGSASDASGSTSTTSTEGAKEAKATPDAKDSASAAARAPFNGYFWRVLSAQGPTAPGGAHSYVINGNMIAGFALVGVPAVHRNAGVMSFLVSHHGKVFEKDLGPDTAKIARTITTFDPGDGWREVDDTTLAAAAGREPADAPFASDDGDVLPAGEPAAAAPAEATSGRDAGGAMNDDSIPSPPTPAVPASMPPTSSPDSPAPDAVPAPTPPIQTPCPRG